MARTLGGRKGLTLALAAAASLVELGPIAVLLRVDAGLVSVLLAGLAYQAGNAIPHPPVTTNASPLLLGITGGALTILVSEPGELGWFVAIGALSWSLQSIRSRFTTPTGNDLPSTAMKRTARVFGFVMATILPPVFWVFAVWLISLAPLAWRGNAKIRQPMKAIAWRALPLEVIMVLHQSHYFAYCYALPLLLDSPSLGGTPLVGTWFACGWISYLLAESIWARFSPARTFVVGHVSLAALLVAMSVFSHLPWPLLCLWILSGLGGGTVYCIAVLHGAEGLPHRRLEVAEDIGHLLGVLVSLVVVMFMALKVSTLPALGAVWAVIAAACMLSLLLLRRTNGAKQPLISPGDADANQ